MGARSRLGCFSCRRRKKKCDEVKPICTACLRNHFPCVWPVQVPQEGASDRGSMLDQQTSNATLLPESDEWALASTSVHRDWPIATIRASPSPIALPGSVLSGSETWRLLDHYLVVTANRLACLQDSANPFLHTLLPAALGDELLMNSTLALSGVHMMQRRPELNREMQSLTWSSYTTALKQLRIALPAVFSQDNSVDAAWRALLVVLIFYLLEATRGNDPKAMQRHLEGAHHLMAHVRSSTSNPTQPSIASFATELYVYNAALASLTTNYSPTPIVLPNNGTNTPAAESSEIGVLCGCAYDLFTLVPRVTSLVWEDAAQTSLPAPFRKYLISQYNELRAQIEEWKPPSNKHELILCAKLYQQSLLLLLDSRFAGDDAPNRIDQAFLSLGSLLFRLPPSSPVATTTTWPIFVFGIHARHQHQKELVRSYLHSLVEVFGMGVMSAALNQLEEIWMAKPGQDVVNRFLTSQSELFLVC